MTSTAPIDSVMSVTRRTYPTREILEWLQGWRDAYGETPTKRNWEHERPPGAPCASAIENRFRGSWTAAILAAGLEPNNAGRKKATA